MKQQKYEDVEVPSGTRINVFRLRKEDGYLHNYSRLTFPDGRGFFLEGSPEGQLFSHLDSSIRDLRRTYDRDWKTRNKVAQGLLEKRIADQSRKALLLRVVEGSRDVAGVVTDLYAEVTHSEVFSTVEGLLRERAMKFTISRETLTSKKIFRVYLLEQWIGEAMDRQQVGLAISNSEIGLGSVGVYLYLERQICSNGMMASTGVSNARLRHIGDQLELKAEVWKMIEETLESAQEIIPAWQSAKKVTVWAKDIPELLHGRLGYPQHLAREVSVRQMHHEGQTAYGLIQAMTYIATHYQECADSYKMKLQQDAHRLLMETHRDPDSIHQRLEEAVKA
jgi:hypothetical protein